uniref:Uncharacterized protein n=1 Tax=Siphoviridae sp. ctdHi7 TaxID=2825577 RepID=A0A8S5U1Y5_9CAUD|nr:MAG TPA: hypothetical protein [Siphoviridae sp. ctdHi7]
MPGQGENPTGYHTAHNTKGAYFRPKTGIVREKI